MAEDMDTDYDDYTNDKDEEQDEEKTDGAMENDCKIQSWRNTSRRSGYSTRKRQSRSQHYN
ncbi:hypothetical protein AMTR_s00104p00137510 [Amborella trichopoda]|uniref:Uncharacterized protein n=1 Tax=Amborella trichopoda TaxID=13333 RepID=W1NXL5_AMBTC|nr:hypothetical protein AMTR_s00104p00137510 [Amborella trichopoda]